MCDFTECFKIQILKTTKDGFSGFHNRYEPIFKIGCQSSALNILPNYINADPFMFVHHGRLYLFYEQQRLYHPGVIAMVSTDDLKHWTKPVVVLKEGFHLSYPRVFEEDGHIYMIPETYQDSSIRLYEAADDTLTQFRFVQKLIEEPKDESITTSFVDSSVYKKDDLYFLHTSIEINDDYVLRLFVSDSLFGPYTEHPSSPILTSAKYGRCAGSLIEHEGHLLRPAQDCEERYGDNVHLFRIEAMTRDAYQETLFAENIFDTAIPFYKEGGHHLNKVEYQGSVILSTDAKEYNAYLLPDYLLPLKKEAVRKLNKLKLQAKRTAKRLKNRVRKKLTPCRRLAGKVKRMAKRLIKRIIHR